MNRLLRMITVLLVTASVAAFAYVAFPKPGAQRELFKLTAPAGLTATDVYYTTNPSLTWEECARRFPQEMTTPTRPEWVGTVRIDPAPGGYSTADGVIVKSPDGRRWLIRGDYRLVPQVIGIIEQGEHP